MFPLTRTAVVASSAETTTLFSARTTAVPRIDASVVSTSADTAAVTATPAAPPPAPEIEIEMTRSVFSATT